MMRLDKFLAHAGVGTRSEVKKLIKHGYVVINRELAFSPNQEVNETSDSVLFDGKPVLFKKNIYLLLNKPKGYLSSTFDYKTPVVLDLMPEYKHRDLYPVGRLDLDTTGLLIITDDGPLGHTLTAPKHEVEKEYAVTVDKPLDESLVEKFKNGVRLEDGYRCLPATLTILDSHRANVAITEGKYHQIKRMFEAYDYRVTELARIRIDFLTLGNLKIGNYRELTGKEVARLKEIK